MIQAATLPLMVITLVIKCIYYSIAPHYILAVLRNAILFNLYQFASIVLLQRLDALTHTIGNTFKRFSGIVFSALVMENVISEWHMKGLLLTFVGFILYLSGGNSFTRKRWIRSSSKWTCMIISLSIISHTYMKSSVGYKMNFLLKLKI